MSAETAKIISRFIKFEAKSPAFPARRHRCTGRIRRVPSSSEELELLTAATVRSELLTGDLDRIETIFDILWYDLASRFAPELLRVVEGIPASAFDARPRLLHAVLLAHHRMSYAEGDQQQLRRALQFFVVTGQRYGKRLTAFTSTGDLMTAGTAAVISRRLRGDYKGSEALGSWTDSQITLGTVLPALPWLTVRAPTRPGWLSSERGLTATLAGSLDRATQLFTRARAEAGDPPYAHYARSSAVANLALLAAFRGHLDLARTWLAEFETSGSLPEWVEQLTATGAEIARTLIAIDEGEPVKAARLLGRMDRAALDTELWPFAAFASACYEAHFGDPHKGLRMLDIARQRHAALRPDPTTLTGELVLRAEAKLLLRVGAGTRVLNLADRHPEVESLMLYAAWAYLLAGEHHEAMLLSSEALQHHDLPVNDLIGHNLVQSVASLRTGRPEHAGSSFRTAIRLRSSPSHISPFLALRDDDLVELAQLAQVANPLGVGTVTARRNTPPSGPLVHVTPREREVLRALSSGMTAEQTAVRFGVSVTTVRTQIRSIYQKLGASHRREALAQAQHLGLLRSPRFTPQDRAG
jgi:LuxR family maltose regulon positive regulatory protein